MTETDDGCRRMTNYNKVTLRRAQCDKNDDDNDIKNDLRRRSIIIE